MTLHGVVAGGVGDVGQMRCGDHALDSFASWGRVRTRFAPSPTARMHAGNIFSSLVAWIIARRNGGQVVLRIEDLDRQRSKQKFADLVMRDFEVLGLEWDEGPYYQHVRDDAYLCAFERLSQRNLVYPCFCTRADLKSASAPHAGEHRVYAGTCRNLSKEEVAKLTYNVNLAGRNPSFRLRSPSSSISFDDAFQGSFTFDLPMDCGDFVLRRSDGSFAYQLAVVIDDAQQGINTVVRGCDLVPSTPDQIILQELLGFEHPRYAHVPLMVNDQGRRLSKRDGDASVDSLLDRFGSPAGVLGHIAYVCGMIESDEPADASSLVKYANLSSLEKTESIVWQG